MSDEEKKNGEYEKPESHGEGDELEGVAGGAGGDQHDRKSPNCVSGSKPSGPCLNGHTFAGQS